MKVPGTFLYLIVLIWFVTGFHPVAAQVVPGRYIVQLEDEPAAPYAAHRGHRAHRGDAVFASRVAELRARQEALRGALEQNGAQILRANQGAINALVVEVADARANGLSSIPGVKSVHPVRMYQRALDHALPLHQVPAAWNLIGGQAYAGLGVMIAIIDTGIDSTHPAFQDPSLTVPNGFPLTNQSSDQAYTNNKIIVARSYQEPGLTVPPATDLDGHGTGVAMAAAGETATGPYGPITGVAPKAFLGNYKVFPDPSGAPTDLIIQAIDDAVSDGMNVLNLSLGSLPAARPAGDDMVAAVENAVAAGVIVTIAAGNSGPDPMTISSPGTAPDAITVGNLWNDRIFAGTLQIGNQPQVIAIPGNGPNSATPITALVVDITQFDPTSLGCQPLPANSLTGAIAFILRGICTFEQKIDYAQQAGAVAALIYTDSARPDPVVMAVGAATLPASMIAYADGIALLQQLSAGPIVATLDFTLQATPVNPNQVDSSSSTGPNTDYGIKPDLVAVGTSVYTAQPLSLGNSGFTVEAGTSFSSPLLAGSAAVLKAALPNLTVAQYRSLLINSANSVNAAAPLGAQQQGAGMLNLAAAVQNTAAAYPASLSFGTGGATINQTLTLTISNVGQVSDSFSVTVLPSSASGSVAPSVGAASVQLDPGQSQAVPVQFASNGLNPADYQGYVQIQGSQSPVAAMVPYWYAVGSGVPAQLTILYAPTSGQAGSQQPIYFRVTDAQGVPVFLRPTITFTSGGGRLVEAASIDQEAPGAQGAIVRLGSTAGQNVIQISLDGISQTVVIQGN